MYVQMGATQENINTMLSLGTVRSFFNKDKEEVQYLSIDDDPDGEEKIKELVK